MRSERHRKRRIRSGWVTEPLVGEDHCRNGNQGQDETEVRCLEHSKLKYILPPSYRVRMKRLDRGLESLLKKVLVNFTLLF